MPLHYTAGLSLPLQIYWETVKKKHGLGMYFHGHSTCHTNMRSKIWISRIHVETMYVKQRTQAKSRMLWQHSWKPRAQKFKTWTPWSTQASQCSWMVSYCESSCFSVKNGDPSRKKLDVSLTLLHTCAHINTYVSAYTFSYMWPCICTCTTRIYLQEKN